MILKIQNAWPERAETKKVLEIVDDKYQMTNDKWQINYNDHQPEADPATAGKYQIQNIFITEMSVFFPEKSGLKKVRIFVKKLLKTIAITEDGKQLIRA